MKGAFMLRTTMFAAAITLGTFTVAMAQEITPAERAACQADYDKYCRGTFPGGGRIIRCLASHYADLSDACKKVVDANKK
jgi:hypothetical protein